MPPAIIITLAVWTLALGPAPEGPSPVGPAARAAAGVKAVAARVGGGVRCVPPAALRRDTGGDRPAPSARAEGQEDGQDDDDPTGRPRPPAWADGPEPLDAPRRGAPPITASSRSRPRRLFLLHGRLTC